MTRSQATGIQRSLEVGGLVRIQSIASCASGLPEADQAKLKSLVGTLRPVAKIDAFGFVWLAFDEGIARDDFCLMAAEVLLA